MELKQMSYPSLLILTSILSVAISHPHSPPESLDCCYITVGYSCFCEVEKETEDYWGYYQEPVTKELYIGDCKCNEISQLSLVLLTTDYAKSITIFDTNNNGNVHCSYSHIHEGQEITCNARDNKLFPDSTSFRIERSDGSLCNGRIDTTCAGDIIINERDHDCDELVVTGYIGDQGGVCDDGLAPCQCIGRYRRIIKGTSSIITGTGSIVGGTSTNTDSDDSDDSANDDSDTDMDSDNDDSYESGDSDNGESDTGDSGDNGDSGTDIDSDNDSDDSGANGDASNDSNENDMDSGSNNDDGEDSGKLDGNQNSDSNEGDGIIASPQFAQFLENRDGAESVGDDEDDSAFDNGSDTGSDSNDSDNDYEQSDSIETTDTSDDGDDSDSNDSNDDDDSIKTTDSSEDTDQSDEAYNNVEGRDAGTLQIIEPMISINDNDDSPDTNDDNNESIDDDLLHFDSDDSNDGLYIDNESNESTERKERAMAIPVNVPLVNIVDQNMAKASIYVTMSYYIILLIVFINTLTFSFYFCIRPLSKYCKDNQYFLKYNEFNMDYNGCSKQSSKDIIIQSSIDPIDSIDSIDADNDTDDNISSLSDATDEEQA